MENKKVESFKDLIVWQKGIELVNEIYKVTKHFPKEELYGLTNQTSSSFNTNKCCRRMRKRNNQKLYTVPGIFTWSTL